MQRIRFLVEHGGGPLWYLYEDGGEDDMVPPELGDCPEIMENLTRITETYDSLFINSAVEFAWKGFDTQAEFEEYKALVLETLTMVHEKLDGLYDIEDHIDVVGYEDPQTPWVCSATETSKERQ